MRVIVSAIGKLKSGPETELVQRYADRAKRSGKSIGLTALDMLEHSESRADSAEQRKVQEEQLLLDKLPERRFLIALDERGSSIDSRKFAHVMRGALDTGIPAFTLVIGGPDGLSPQVRKQADHVLSFGQLTIPHQLVRVLVLEQVYRAITILTNHPYHRD